MREVTCTTILAVLISFLIHLYSPAHQLQRRYQEYQETIDKNIAANVRRMGTANGETELCRDSIGKSAVMEFVEESTDSTLNSTPQK